MVGGVVAEEAGGVEGRGGDPALANCELAGTFPLELGCGVLVATYTHPLVIFLHCHARVAGDVRSRSELGRSRKCVADLRKRAVAPRGSTPHRRCRASVRVRGP